MGRNKEKGRGKRQRPNGPPAPTPAAIANQTGRLLTEREAEWLDRLVVDPASFAAVEREVHDQARQQADLYVAGLLAKASEHPEMAHTSRKRLPRLKSRCARLKKKTPPGGAAFGGLGDHGDDAVRCAGGVAARDEASREVGSTRNWRPIGSARGPAPTCKPKWAAWSVSYRSSRRAPSWLDVAWNWTRKRFGESPVNWGLKCWRPAPVTCYGSVPGNCPRGTNSPTRGSRSGLMVAGFGWHCR